MSMKRISLSRTRRLKIVVATLIVVLIVSVVYLMRHQSNPNSQEEQYPPSQSQSWVPTFNVTLNMGDSWKLALTINESEYNLTMTVIDEETVHDVSCYVMNLTFEPENPRAETGISNKMTAWLDKSTFNIVQLKGTGTAQTAQGEYDFRYTETHSYTFQGGNSSMTVGTEYNQTDTKIIDIDVKFGLIWIDWDDDKSTTTRHMKVEAVEDVNVTTGTFSCYKIVTYNETGQTPLSTRWFSMEAKTAVKSENYETGEKSELLSYTI